MNAVTDGVECFDMPCTFVDSLLSEVPLRDWVPVDQPKDSCPRIVENKSQLAFTAGLQGGAKLSVLGAKLDVTANFGRQEWNAIGPNTVSERYALGLDVYVARIGLDASRSAVGTTRAPRQDIFGRTVEPGLSMEQLLPGHPWKVKEFAEFRGLELDSDLVIGIDVATLIGVKAELDLGWLYHYVRNALAECK